MKSLPFALLFLLSPAFSAPLAARPAMPAGVRAIAVQPMLGAADVTRLIPNTRETWRVREKLQEPGKGLLPLDAVFYRDAVGGSFVGIDVSKNSESILRFPDLYPHEISTILKILKRTRDLQVLLREDQVTPDLVVNGVVTEIKSAYKHVKPQLASANRQLVQHARRHGLTPGRGAVVLDVGNEAVANPQNIEAAIAHVIERTKIVGFNRVHVFTRGAVRTYAPQDGVFRYNPQLRAFSEPSALPVADAKR